MTMLRDTFDDQGGKTVSHVGRSRRKEAVDLVVGEFFYYVDS